MSSGWTPGPWFGPNFNNSTAEPTRAMTGKFKQRGHKSPTDYLLRVEISGENVAANAHLIAAAPELYEAARLFVEEYDASEDAGDVGMMLAYNRALEAAKTALAKARGEQVSA